jgi:hypothetical protein
MGRRKRRSLDEIKRMLRRGSREGWDTGIGWLGARARIEYGFLGVWDELSWREKHEVIAFVMCKDLMQSWEQYDRKR